MPYTEEGVKKVNSLTKKGYVYGGGDFEEHKRYWKIFSESHGLNQKNHPPFKSNCVCGQELERNCWVFKVKDGNLQKKANGDVYCKTIGSECINKFLDKRRTCHMCGKEHNNRIVNRCNYCRVGLCDICGVCIDYQYKRCYNCK